MTNTLESSSEQEPEEFCMGCGGAPHEGMACARNWMRENPFDSGDDEDRSQDDNA